MTYAGTRAGGYGREQHEEIAMKRFLVVTLAAGALAGLTACDSMPVSKQTQGAALGAAAGGVAGHALFGSTLGTVGGAVAGGVVGSEVGKRQDRR
jgi:osmotically inducible lipoprotein OsmB